MRSVAAHGEFEEFVVLRITASCNSYTNLNPFSLARQSREKASNIFLIHIPAEPLPTQNLVEFDKNLKGE